MSKITESPTFANQSDLVALIPNSKRYIFVVDDDSVIRRSLQKTLLEAGFFADVAGDYNEAVEILKKKSYSLVILDIAMPDWSNVLSERAGVDLVKEVRILNPQASIIMLTAGSKDIMAVEAIKSGADEYLIKGNLSNSVFITTVAKTILRAGKKGADPPKPQWREWFAQHTSGVIDEILASIFVAFLFYVFGKILGLLKGVPSGWIQDPVSSGYLLISVVGIIVTISVYMIFQKWIKRKGTSRRKDNRTGGDNEKRR